MTESWWIMTRFKSIVLHTIFGIIGGGVYYAIEILWRGYSHWSMWLLGGVCFVLIGLLDEWQNHPPLWRQAVQGAIIVTVLEFLAGCIVNLWLGWGIWDYSDMPLNLLGQICLPFSLAWVALSVVAIKLENFMHQFFDA